jgi:hypothetical protein
MLVTLLINIDIVLFYDRFKSWSVALEEKQQEEHTLLISDESFAQRITNIYQKHKQKFKTSKKEQWVSLVDQELLTLLEQLSSPYVLFVWVLLLNL